MLKEEKNVKRSKFRTNITKKGLKRVNDKTMISLSLPGKKYDSTCKELFQNKEIIAPVLKAVVPEYKNSTVEEIIRYIDADSIKDIQLSKEASIMRQEKSAINWEF